MDISKELKEHLKLSFLYGRHSKVLLHKLLLIKSLEICKLAEEKDNYNLSVEKYKLEVKLKKFK